MTTPQPLGLGTRRDGAFYAPASDLARRPLILYLHGAGGSGARSIQLLVEYARRTGAIVVAPDSRAMTWGVLLDDETADIAFIDAALKKMFDAYPIDPGRVSIAGFSDGASAALSWGLINGDLFSNVVAFSPGSMILSSEPRGKPRVFVSHGTRDQVLPIDRCGRPIARALRTRGYTVDYREFEGEHTIPPDIAKAGLDAALGK